jgi:HlyD family secretion protein
MMSPAPQPHKASLAPPLLTGYALILVLVVGFGTYATMTSISGAVVSPGLVVVETGAKPVQHPEGGVVAEILVSEGDEVQAGQRLVRLDDVQTRANLGVTAEQLIKQRAVLLRLRAERDQLTAFSPPQDTNASEKEAYASEKAQFEIRRNNILIEKTILEQKISQFELAIQGFEADIHSISETNRIASAEYNSIKPLIDKGITPLTKGLVLEREIASLIGRKGQRIADVAKTRDQISETKLQLLKIDGDFRSQILKEIAEAEAQIRELTEKQLIAQDKLNRIDIRSPQKGIIQNMTIFSAGGVIKASDTIMIIIPKDDKLVIEARVSPQQIDQVRVGQSAMIRFSNFNRRQTPELKASVELVAPDLAAAQGSLQNAGKLYSPSSNTNSALSSATSAYYTVRLQIMNGELAKLEGASLLPGMMVETLISTDERSIMSYLIKPLTDRLALAFRER